jgi:hypothetical protein
MAYPTKNCCKQRFGISIKKEAKLSTSRQRRMNKSLNKKVYINVHQFRKP